MTKHHTTVIITIGFISSSPEARYPHTAANNTIHIISLSNYFPNNAHLLLEPLHGLLLGDPVSVAHSSLLPLPVPHPQARTSQHHIEIHPIDTDARVVLDPQVYVLLDPKAKVALVREVVLSQLVLSHFEPLLQDLLCLGTPHGAVDSYFLITTDAKGSDSETS